MKTIGFILLGIFALSAILTVISRSRENKDRADGNAYREHLRREKEFKNKNQ